MVIGMLILFWTGHAGRNTSQKTNNPEGSLLQDLKNKFRNTTRFHAAMKSRGLL
jgi:hypothetical protein